MDMKKMIKKEYQKYILYSLFGLIWSLSNIGYVKYVGSLFAWITLAPCIFFLSKETIKDGIKFSLLFGFVAYITHFWWMTTPMTIVMKDTLLAPQFVIFSFVIGITVTLGASLLQGLFYTLTFLLARYVSCGKKILYYLGFAFGGTVLDYFFPKIWADYLGYSQYKITNIIQIVDVFGISFITLFVLLINSAFAYLAECIVEKKRYFFAASYLFSGVLLFICMFIYGNQRVETIKKLIKNAEQKKIGMVQGNISGLDKRDKTKTRNMINTYNDLSKKILDQNPDLIVWPESSIPIWFNENESNYEFVKKFGKANLLFGTLSTTDTMEKRGNIYNSIILLDEKARKKDFYYKNILVPFTEAAPHKSLDFIMKLINLRSFSKGDSPKIFSLDDMKISPNICYEDIMPEYILKSLKYKKIKANLIINVSNDSWFGKTIEPEMHLRIASFRAIENRKYLVKVTCTGYSGIVDALGNVAYRSKLMEKDTHVATVSLLNIETFYSRIGWFFIYVLGVFLAIIFIYVTHYRYSNYYRNLVIKNEIEHEEKLKNIWIS